MASQKKTLERLAALTKALIQQCGVAGVSLPGAEEVRLKMIDALECEKFADQSRLRGLTPAEEQILFGVSAVQFAADVKRGELRASGAKHFSDVEDGLFFKIMSEFAGGIQQAFLDCLKAEFTELSGSLVGGLGVVNGEFCLVQVEIGDTPEEQGARFADAFINRLMSQVPGMADHMAEGSAEMDEIDKIIGSKVQDPGSGRAQ